jgi:pimeloyl-ACP methyl ester carboxylesterase
LNIKELGNFFVGGGTVNLTGLPVYEAVFVAGGPKRVVDNNGEYETGQMYVQFVKLENPQKTYPVLFWHGGGCTGAAWETTPDGRPGWQMRFLEAGYDVYVSDAVERGRSSWSKYPEIYASEPVFRNKKGCWEVFRIGPDYENKKPFPVSQFPAEYFSAFCKQMVPRWTTNHDAIRDAYEACLDKVGECIIVAHSQGCEFANELALRRPENIKAIVHVECSSAPPITPANLEKTKKIPYLYLWGDFIEQVPLWQKYSQNTHEYYAAQQAAGADVKWLSLPERGIKGNGHALMLEKNSDDIFAIVKEWLAGKNL